MNCKINLSFFNLPFTSIIYTFALSNSKQSASGHHIVCSWPEKDPSLQFAICRKNGLFASIFGKNKNISLKRPSLWRSGSPKTKSPWHFPKVPG